ncbi:hypothetical protein C1645_821602 [Glomus cerebriforme]|uniref:Shelterin complex subunit TPP1/Est3 domain-containing protein n=1 Tax=Glomus cerebriforme TaxID=658196 RepID=A0A397T600_9GLOM|nr:hypothetical protein C1645_821602 [Glomus cerebriforme]
MLRDFFVKPWIKNAVLNYLFNEEEYQFIGVRAQVLRLTISEESELNEHISAEIHDYQHYIKCSFANESLGEYNRHSIDYMVGGLIIIKDYTIFHEIDYSSTNKHECFLIIKNFDYTKNITDEQEESLQVKYICEEMEVKETLQAKDKKPKYIDHPGWNGFRRLFYNDSVDIRTVPLDQIRIMNDIPVKVESTASTEWSLECPESPHDSDETISLKEEDSAIITKGNYEQKENYRKDKLYDEEVDDGVHFERAKRKCVDSDPDDGTFSKKQSLPNAFCSYVR